LYFFGSLDCLVLICWRLFTLLSFFLQSLIINIVWFPASILHWIQECNSTHIMRNAHQMEELTLYRPSKSFHPFRKLVPTGEKFSRVLWSLLLCFCFVLKHLPLMLCMVEYLEETPLDFLISNICNETQVNPHMRILWGSLLYVFNLFCSSIPYINPQSDCHQLPKGRLKVQEPHVWFW
jgi:hypothetical protein